MHILITDSGVGGLSVCAYAERVVRTHGCKEPVRLTFANAAPANDYGYNAMPSRQLKIETFDRFLRSVVDGYAPDFIYVACNTLSVLLPDTPFARGAAIPIRGIIETGVESLLRELVAAETAAMIFATQTTIDAGVHARLLEARGVEPTRIISQACPGLADIISEDREGVRARPAIQKWVNAAIEKLPDANVPVVACLACTHYGYRKQLFAEALVDAGIRATVIDPNEHAAVDMFGTQLEESKNHRDVDVQLVTRYALPDTTRAALTHFLGDISPRTVAAMQSFIHRPELF
jgi:glutamate racemase